MTKYWTSKIVIAGLTVALGLPAAAAFADKGDTVKERRNDGEVPHIVREAKVVREGRNEELEYRAPEDGQVWLYDVTDKEVLHSITLKKGHSYGIEPKKNHVIVNGKEGERVKIDSKKTYRIYYVTETDRDAINDPKRKAESKRVMNKRSEARVPDTAKVEMEGVNKEFSVKAAERGTYYLYDATNSNVLDIYNVVPGDRLTIIPKDNAISINGQQISEDVALDRKTNYRLLFNKHE